ncbi:DNA polymerase I [Rubrivirga sp. IMCC43871]|uniref:DNA polymerase I n=1 Tax=Rubrivirga sp. IMCC43871 TaxID=3391575 RepID=UPI00398FF12D
MADQPSLFDNVRLDVTLPDDLDDPLAAVESDAGRETLFLADAMALAYRAFFSMKNASLSAPDGTDTRTLYGFTTALLKLLEDEQPEHIAVVFDVIGGGPTFRDELYADYKGHRPPMPPEIKSNIPLLKRLCTAFDIPVLEVDGMEADDVIGTLAKRAEDEGVDAVIFSADKDFRQLLSDRVSMLRPPYQGEAFDLETPETFRAKYGGLEPAQFVELLALMGDSADNVPGVPGIGEKTAIKLIEEYGTVENLIAHAGDLKGKRAREGMTTYADDARLSKQLVTIRCDVPLTGPDGQELDWHTLRRTDPDLDEVEALFNEVGFGSRLRNRVRDYAAGRQRTPRTATTLPEEDPSLSFDFGPYEPVTALDAGGVSYATVYEVEDIGLATEAVTDADQLSFDTETTSVDPMHAELVGVALSKEEETAVYLPTPLPDGTPTETALDAIRAALEDPDLPKVGHNVKYDLKVLARHGVTVRGDIFDTMVAHYLINPEASHKLDDVASFHLNYRPQPITDLIGTGKNAITMREVAVEDAGPYACEDADVALRLVPILTDALEAVDDGEGRLLQIANEIEFPLVPVLAAMEMAGVKVDEKVLADIRVQLDAQIEELEGQIFEQTGREFGIGSPKQIGEVLFNPPPTDEDHAAYQTWLQDMRDYEAGEVAGDPDAKPKTKKQLAEEAPTFGLGLIPLGKTKSGQPKTDEKVLSELAQEHALPALILDWRKVSKLKSTYVDKLPELIHPDTGRVHTDFNQTVTATGRLSSSNPNLQNIPIRTDLGKEIRRAFVAEPGHVLMAADYAQIELRIIASMSGDPDMTAAFAADQDIHTAAAARVFDVAYDEVTRAQRDRVKQVNYGIPYGISAFGLASRLRIGNAEAKELIDQYRASYPRVIEFLDGLVVEARERGYVETLLGRRRYLPLIGSRNPNDRAFAERVAVNMPIQGTQADMIKIAMLSISRGLPDVSAGTRMILQVHDELVFEVPEAHVEAVSAFVREQMATAYPLGDVPVVVDIGVADNWLDAH